MVERINKREGKLLARDELKRALEELKGAEILQDSSLYFKSVVSSYYSVYHAAKAALLLKGAIPKSHEGVERMFSLYYIKTGEFGIDTGKIIGRLMKLREEADYYPESVFRLEDSREALGLAKSFVEVIQGKLGKSLT
jgi:uncharacterized protein (UPF0332 family)